MVCQRVVRCVRRCVLLLCACLLGLLCCLLVRGCARGAASCCCAACCAAHMHVCIGVPDVPSCNWYMTSTQPSNVILWKRVTIAQGYESNDVAP